MVIRDIGVRSFDDPAALLIYRGSDRISPRHAPLGLLLNRVKRMRIGKGSTFEVVCENTIFSRQDVLDLLKSVEYQSWLSTPTLLHPSGDRDESR